MNACAYGIPVFEQIDELDSGDQGAPPSPYGLTIKSKQRVERLFDAAPESAKFKPRKTPSSLDLKFSLWTKRAIEILHCDVVCGKSKREKALLQSATSLAAGTRSVANLHCSFSERFSDQETVVILIHFSGPDWDGFQTLKIKGNVGLVAVPETPGGAPAASSGRPFGHSSVGRNAVPRAYAAHVQKRVSGRLILVSRRPFKHAASDGV
jgi:hypothetical protein